MKQKTGRKLLGVLLMLAMVIGLLPGMGLTAYAADEVSENISLVASDSSNLKTISGTHYSVSCGYMSAGSSGMQVCKAGALTINARKGETITKVVLTYNWGNNKSSLSASAGTFDGNATISDINAQQVTISSSNTAGVKISAVRVYFEGSLSNPTVTLTGGANAKSSGGLLTQSYLPGAMDTVTYTALTGAAFPEFETFTQNGVTVERTSDTVVTVSGTPTANTEITVPDAESSSKIVTWGSSIIKDSGRNGLEYQIRRNNSYSDTANGITLTKSGSGYASLSYGDWTTRGDVTLNFTTATGKFTSIEIETSQIYDGGNWTKDGNTLKWNGTSSNSVSLSGSMLYLEGVSSINFVIEMPTVSVTITPGSNMTKTTDSGDAEQTGLSGAMTPVVYTANEGYYFPENYSVEAVNEISVTRNSYTQITVSGTPTADAAIALTAPTAKTTPAAPTTAGAVDCTTSDNNDGKLTGVTTAMEYKKSDAESWTVGTGSDITGLVPGTYYVRVKATDTTNASANQELMIADYLSVTKTAAKADLDTLQSGKNQNDYDAADWTTLTQAITDGKTAIDNATTTEAITTAKNNAVDAVNAVKTKAQKLADAKTTAKNDLDTLLGTKTESDYDEADWTALTQAITDGKTAIDNATTTEAITTAKNNAVDAVNAVKTKAQKLADAKTTAKNDLDTLLGTKTESDYDAADWITLTQAITDGKTAIENATTTDAVATAKTNAEASANAVKTTAEKLADAKTAAKADLDTLLGEKTEADYDADDWTTLTQAIADGKTAIDNATTIDDVVTAKSNAETAANAVKTTAEKLADAKTAAKADLDTLLGTKTESDYDEADWTALTQAITDGKTAIDNATTIDDVATAKSNAETAANAVKTTAEKKEEADTAAANGVSNTINNLPAANEVTTANKNAIEAARAAYNALTDDQKAKVSAETLKKLTDAEDRLVVLQVMSEVSAKTGSGMTYTGSPIQLINTPTTSLPNGYTMKYAVTTENTAPADNLYTTSIPTATDAGTYYVWYKVAGDGNHLDSDAGVVNVVIYEPGSPDIPTPTPTPTPVTPETTPPVSVSYGTHIQSKGWEDPAKKDGEISGTTGESKRLEAIKIDLAGNENVGIQYTTHVQGIGWMPWSCNGEVSGTTGESKRLEAIKIQLTGADKDKYDVYYRVHAQSYGWMAWAKNGEAAGTAGQSKRLEAIQVVVVEKGAAAPGDVAGVTSAKDKSYLDASNSDNPENPQVSGEDQAAVAYRTHVQTYGWQNWKANGQMAGTTGQSKRLEAININISNKPYAGGIRYKTHVQTYGWQDFVADGAASGTSGESKRLEAICIELTGEMAEHYDVYYRVHAQTYGWLDWASNGAPAGTEGLSKRLEGIEIVLVEKGAPAPGATDRPFVK